MGVNPLTDLLKLPADDRAELRSRSGRASRMRSVTACST